MKRKIVSLAVLFLLLIFVLTSCIPDDDKNSKSPDPNDSMSAISKDNSSNDDELNVNSEYENIVDQLEELENVLNSLDIIFEDDLEIPQP